MQFFHWGRAEALACCHLEKMKYLLVVAVKHLKSSIDCLNVIFIVFLIVFIPE